MEQFYLKEFFSFMMLVLDSTAPIKLVNKATSYFYCNTWVRQTSRNFMQILLYIEIMKKLFCSEFFFSF